MNERYGREYDDKSWPRENGWERRNDEDRADRNFSRGETREPGQYSGGQQRAGYGQPPRSREGYRYEDERSHRGPSYGSESGSNSQYRQGAGQFGQGGRGYGREQWAASHEEWRDSQDWQPSRGRNQFDSDREQSEGWSGSSLANPIGSVWGSGPSYSAPRPRADWRSESYGSNRAGSHFGKGPKGYVRSDERIREDICDRLSNDDEVDASDISVTVKDGEVKLEGTVPDRRSKHRAEDIADAVGGVKDVHNSLRAQKSFLQEVGDRITGNDEAQQHGHSGSGTRNGGTSSQGSTGSSASRV